MSREQSKAANYIQLLDEARCNGNWDAVPELIRKVRKHAPARTCLTLTAEVEHAITQASQTHPNNPHHHLTKSRPSTATFLNPTNISSFIPLLLEAIDKENTYIEDEFQAQVCLGWLHWFLGEPALAASRLPKSIEQEFAQLDGTGKESAQWTTVCALKASYLKGCSQERTGATADAVQTFDSSLPILTSIPPKLKSSKEMSCWIELYLTGFCIVSSHAVKTGVTSLLETRTLSAFRAWSNFWEGQASSPQAGHAPYSDTARHEVWREYFITLSDLLQQNLPFPTTSLAPAYSQSSTRLQQRAELKSVEAKYESLLLTVVQFPKADESVEEVETFVNIVMQNWRVLCGSTWLDEDLGEGGADAVSRGVLDILYRAATKTFHSTAILRHLFTVHLAIAEFDLAFKAFDTYLEIVKKGKARVEKTGELEQALDSDEIVLQTASECIKALCRYGDLRAAEKAKDLGQYFEDWLNKHHPSEPPLQQSNGTGRLLENGNNSDFATISPRILAMAWSSIGIGYAQWARLTFDASSRTETQLRTIKCFRKALLPGYENSADVGTLFALGLALAERRELAAAIEVVKSGLLPPQLPPASQASGLDAHAGPFTRERSLIPLWHLLALLLSARQEFIVAARACEGAFEQFQEPKNLFGDGDLSETYRSDHLNEKASRSRGIVDDMSDFERENVLEVKMTQLALVEVLEGPEVAVNASDELLSLYARLFGDPQKVPVTPMAPTTLGPRPKSSAATVKSVKGSIFGRSDRSVRRLQNVSESISDTMATTLRPQTMQTIASTITRTPSIQVTSEKGENGGVAKDQPSRHKLEKRSESLTRKKESGSLRTRSTSAGRVRTSSKSHAPTDSTSKPFISPTDNEDREQWLNPDTRASQVGLAISPDNSTSDVYTKEFQPPVLQKPLPTKLYMQQEKSFKPHHSNPSLVQGSRVPYTSPYSPSTNPVTRFPKSQERRHRMTILVKVWLLIGGFYRRASMYDDAKGAIDEAFNLVQKIETDVSTDTSVNVSVDHAGWGGGKSVSELWGDVFSERGYLSVAQESPYTALSNFETALIHFNDHPSAIVGLSSILLDIYTEELLPPAAIPALILPGTLSTPSASTTNSLTVSSTPMATTATSATPAQQSSSLPLIPVGPLGLPSSQPKSTTSRAHLPIFSPLAHVQPADSPPSSTSPATSNTAARLQDRLAARDRAYGLLSTLTKLGSGWNYSEAWFALARAYEESGQLDKAREVLWWCVELEESRGIRAWSEVIGGGGYVL